MNWLLESNRLKHLLFAIPCGLFLTILFVLGLALGMEFKDKQYGNEFDWLDVSATMIGGTIGQIIMLLIIFI
nr:MAG TPA: putative periplasmic lipoprotein [Bacteriophage sp.]